MTKAYRAHDPLGTYFMTMTVVDWVDVFTNLEFKDLVVGSLKYCMEHKGLDLYAWVLMSNHIHLIGAAREPYLLSDIVRDFKKYTNKRIIAGLESGCDSRGVWMLKKFEYARGKRHGIEGYKLWQDGYHAINLFNAKVFEQKLKYTHNNPVKQGIVTRPEDYIYSSAVDYTGEKGLLPIILA